MKELPDLSRIMAARTSAKKGGSGGEVNPPSPRGNTTVSAAGARAPKEDTSKKVAPKKKKKKQDPEALEEHRGGGPSEQARTGDGSKKGKKKKRKGIDEETKALRVAAEDPEEPSSTEVPLKKRRKKKETDHPDPRPCARMSSGFWCPTSYPRVGLRATMRTRQLLRGSGVASSGFSTRIPRRWPPTISEFRGIRSIRRFREKGAIVGPRKTRLSFLRDLRPAYLDVPGKLRRIASDSSSTGS
ncbi:hypothetical protein Bca52824_016273 [Brassica carinata]|uniref:Uncharacterized protein n=1 Tax=Brassica carinata TaxID=52824 RepID=A0A8X7W625_BRACI|nr:hypothetical protein Bca52824_016273 [Brassica carinata]